MKNTKYLALGLASIIVFSPMISSAIRDDVINTSDKEVISEIEEATEYIAYKGKITDIEKDKEKDTMSILVQGEDKKVQQKIVFHIREDMTILSQKTSEFKKRSDLKEDSQVTVFFKENTPMTMSIPAQASPDLVLINDSKEASFVKVSHFNEELVDIKGELKLNISEDTVIVDIDGKDANKDKLKSNDLVVFYTMTTKSIPAQTTPEKIIILATIENEKVPENNLEQEGEDVKDKLRVMDKVVLNGKELELNHVIYTSQSGHHMIAIRPVGEALGYKVSWNNKERSAELTKDAQWTKATIGKDDYNFAKMIVKLGKAPEIKDQKTYVPIEFLEEVLKLDVKINNGVLQAK